MLFPELTGIIVFKQPAAVVCYFLLVSAKTFAY